MVPRLTCGETVECVHNTSTLPGRKERDCATVHPDIRLSLLSLTLPVVDSCLHSYLSSSLFHFLPHKRNHVAVRPLEYIVNVIPHMYPQYEVGNVPKRAVETLQHEVDEWEHEMYELPQHESREPHQVRTDSLNHDSSQITISGHLRSGQSNLHRSGGLRRLRRRHVTPRMLC